MIEALTLDSGLRIALFDRTRHYFGGYYHVSVLVQSDITLERSYFDSEAEFLHAVEKMGRLTRFERILEKMAVPEADVAAVRDRLIRTFYETGRGYLASPDFAPRFVRSEYRKICSKTPQRHKARS